MCEDALFLVVIVHVDVFNVIKILMLINDDQDWVSDCILTTATIIAKSGAGPDLGSAWLC